MVEIDQYSVASLMESVTGGEGCNVHLAHTHGDSQFFEVEVWGGGTYSVRIEIKEAADE